MNKPQQQLPIFLLVEWCVEEKNYRRRHQERFKERVLLSPLCSDLAYKILYSER
jgi:hypothetical protein